MSPRRAVLFVMIVLAAIACSSRDDDGRCSGCGSGSDHSIAIYPMEVSTAKGTVTLRWTLGEQTFSISTSETEPIEVLSDIARDWLADGGLDRDAGDVPNDAGVDEDSGVDSGGASAGPIGEPIGTKKGRVAVVAFGKDIEGTFELATAGATVIRCEHPFEELVGNYLFSDYRCRSEVLRPATVERLAGIGHLSAPTDAGDSTVTELRVDGMTPSGTRVVLTRRSSTTPLHSSNECY